MGIKRDFSQETVEMVREIVRKTVDETEEWGITDWFKDTFTMTDWDIDDYLNNVEEYQTHMIDNNDIDLEMFDKILQRVEGVDNSYGNRFASVGYRQESFAGKIAGMTALLSPKAFAMTNEEYAKMSTYLDDYYLQSVEESNESIEYYESTMIEIEDPEWYEKALNGAGGFVVSVVRDNTEGILTPARLFWGGLDYLTGKNIGSTYDELVTKPLDNLDNWVVENLVTDPESYYEGRIWGDRFCMAEGIVIGVKGIGTFITGIVGMAGGIGFGTVTSPTGIGAIVGYGEAALATAATLEGGLELATGAGMSISSYDNLNENARKLNEVRMAESNGGGSNQKQYSGKLEQVSKPDPAADALAERIGGKSRVKYSNDPEGREFDAISDEYIAQAKPALSTVNKSVRKQMKATFEAAKMTGKRVYYQFEGEPAQSVINKLYEYSERYGIDVTIDTNPLGVSN